jgi:BNR repeat protein
MRERLRAAALAALLSCAAIAKAEQHVTSGPEMDYQPAILKSSDDGARIVVFERLDPSTTFGDLWITRSIDGGDTWSEPTAIIATDANERHPALLQTGASQYALFYLKGVSAATSFRIFRATSSDGVAFAEAGQVDLGWPTGGEINPHVVRHADGTLTMSYQRLGTGAGVYVAESTDDGVTWDTQQTAIAANAQLPRIVYRESDGLYLATYQTGSSALRMWVKTTADVHDWSAAARDFAGNGNNHDSLPVVMPDDAFIVFWIRAAGEQFDIAVRRSIDGVDWSTPLTVTDTPDADDVEPHPLVGESSSEVELYWGRDAPVGSFTYDIVREPAVLVNDAIFADTFDG